MRHKIAFNDIFICLICQIILMITLHVSIIITKSDTFPTVLGSNGNSSTFAHSRSYIWIWSLRCSPWHVLMIEYFFLNVLLHLKYWIGCLPRSRPYIVVQDTNVDNARYIFLLSDPWACEDGAGLIDRIETVSLFKVFSSCWSDFCSF